MFAGLVAGNAHVIYFCMKTRNNTSEITTLFFISAADKPITVHMPACKDQAFNFLASFPSSVTVRMNYIQISISFMFIDLNTFFVLYRKFCKMTRMSKMP